MMFKVFWKQFLIVVVKFQKARATFYGVNPHFFCSVAGDIGDETWISNPSRCTKVPLFNSMFPLLHVINIILD